MAIWPFNRRKKPEEQRLSQDDWAKAYEQFFSFGGMTYPIVSSPYQGGDHEPPPNDFDSYVRNAYKGSGIFFTVCEARARPFTEMRFCYQQMSQGRPTGLYGSKNLEILENPWPNGDTGELLKRALQDADLSGNFYCVKEFDKVERKFRLRRLYPGWVDIVLSGDPREDKEVDVVGYLYKPGNDPDPKKWITYPADGSKGVVAHWSPIPDPEAQYRGMSWLTPIVREIMIDKGATKHKEKFFEQGATPQLAVSLKDTDIQPEQFKEFVRAMETSSSGVDNAYKTLYLAGGADVTVVGAHMQQLDLRNMQSHIETRIAGAGGIHHMLIGIAEPIHGSPLDIGGYQAAKDMFGEMWLKPTWRSLCNALSVLVEPRPGSRLWYDDRDVAFMRSDRQAQADLLTSMATTVNTFMMAGFTPDSITKFMSELAPDGDWSLLKHSGLASVQMQPLDGSGNQGPAGTPPGPVPAPKRQGAKSVGPPPKQPKSKPPKTPGDVNQTNPKNS